MLLLGLLLAIGGCDNNNRPTDAGMGTDTGMPTDSGTPTDSGMGMDAGDTDAGDTDAGTDAGDTDAGTDAGMMDMDAGPPGGGMLTSAQIRDVRMAATAATGTPIAADLPIADAIVTYVKPTAGAEDPSGFFVQAETTGPALFVQVDTAALSPTPEVGQVVSFNVDEVNNINAVRQATMISGWMVASSGHDVSFLIQEVSAVDLVTDLELYDSELIEVTMTLDDAVFTFAGPDHVQDVVTTMGVSDGSARLRLPQTVRDALTMYAGCDLTLVATPLWRFMTTPQFTTYDAAEATVTCDAPVVTGAVATSPTEVIVSFDHALDPASVMASGVQFAIVTGVTVVAASASGNQVTLTTSAQTPAEVYTVSADNTVLDDLGVGVDAAANSAMFTGFVPPTDLIINEVDYDSVGTDNAEFVEIYNPTSAPILLTNYFLVGINGSGGAEYVRVALTGTLGPGEYAVVTGSVAGGSMVAVPGGVARFEAAVGTNVFQNGAPDGVALIEALPIGPPRLVDALSYEGAITAATISGSTYDLTSGDAAAGTHVPGVDDSNTVNQSLSRLPNGADSDVDGVDWGLGMPTPGAANAAL